MKTGDFEKIKSIFSSKFVEDHPVPSKLIIPSYIVENIRLLICVSGRFNSIIENLVSNVDMWNDWFSDRFNSKMNSYISILDFFEKILFIKTTKPHFLHLAVQDYVNEKFPDLYTKTLNTQITSD